MKISFRAIVLATGLFLITLLFISCAKPDHSIDKPKEQQVIGEWQINRIELNVFSGGVLIKDSIIPRAPKPKNFVEFSDNGGFKYQFNSTTVNTGTYQWVGNDIVSVTPGISFSWKTLTLTNVLFTVKSTSTNDPAFPGCTVNTYHTFVR
ncbi:MAG TPA: hypothetical protein VHL77_01125 [Ferruginibacter sp.]|jgi:hypothetical protein|nr:hypothetical protein [Ferruginibacter sp.]